MLWERIVIGTFKKKLHGFSTNIVELHGLLRTEIATNPSQKNKIREFTCVLFTKNLEDSV